MSAYAKNKLVLSALAMSVSCALSTAHADDLEIYNHHTIVPISPSVPPSQQPPPQSKPVLMLVLNIGVGMGIEAGSYDADYGISNIKSCVRGDPDYSARRHKLETRQLPFYDENGNRTSQSVAYRYETCDGNPTRISVLREAFLQFLTNPNPKISDYKQNNNIQSPLGKISDFKIGLASNFALNGPNGGQILYPALDMTDANRYQIAQQIAALSAAGKEANPLALTIAETMAYFSGGRTNAGNIYPVAFPLGLEQNGQFIACDTTNAARKLSTNRFDHLTACPSGTWVRGADKAVTLGPYQNNPLYNVIPQKEGTNTYYFAELKTGTFPYSGFRIAHPDSRVLGNSYRTPLSPDNECAANGIYFLSDGDALDVTNNSYGGKDTYRATLNTALRNQPHVSITAGNNNVCRGTLDDATIKKQALGVTSTLYSYWSCAGEMAKAARARFDNSGNIIRNQSFRVTDNYATDPDRREFNADVRFASVGYGGGLKEVKDARRYPKQVVLPGGTQKGEVQAYNCDSFTDARAKNMCKLGEHGAGYGEGGFYYVDVGDTEAVTESVVNFMFSLTPPPPTDKPSDVILPPPDRTPLSTGAMSAPIDPLTGNIASGSVYLPILDPKPGSNVLWNGNLKKYKVNDARMFGANNQPVIKNEKGEFNPDTYDFWNSAERPDGAMPQVGGTYSQLFRYNQELSRLDNLAVGTRNLWVDTADGLMKIAGPADVNTKLSTRNDLAQLAPILGGYAQSAPDYTLGAVLHSSPQLIAYEIGVNSNGNFVADSRKDAVIYGSMEGALHLVDNTTGQELFSFVPQEMLDLQPDALNEGTTKANKVPHGVDGPWTVTSRHDFSADKTKYKATSVIASGGLRMGGSKYYSLDISNKTAPTLLYTVGSNYGKKLQDNTVALAGFGGKSAAENAAYARMGQSWAKPSVGYVRSGGKKVMVDFLAGGYDYGYESADYVPVGNAQGNAVYAVQVGEERLNSTTNRLEITPTNSGKLLWWATQGAANSPTNAGTSLQASTHPEMNHSVVSQIRVLDRDSDGYVDHIYYADLGGRVWRADLDNKKPTCPIENGQERCSDSFKVTRVVKVLDVSGQKSGSDTAPRFYERPLVTFTKEIDGGVTGMVSIGSGNRSLPVSATRQTPDALYTFLDKDIAIARNRMYDPNTTMATKNLTVADLSEIRFVPGDVQVKSDMLSGVSQGWYYPLAEWVVDGVAQPATGLKSFNEPDALAGYLFTTVYNPSAIVNGTASVAPPAPAPTVTSKCGVPTTVAPPVVTGSVQRGVTQRRLMCLPFGNCAIDKGGDFTRIPAVNIGIGIIGNVITTEGGSAGGLVGTLVTHCTGADCGKKQRPDDPNGGNTPTGGVGSDPDKKGFDSSLVLNPRDWWEK